MTLVARAELAADPAALPQISVHAGLSATCWLSVLTHVDQVLALRQDWLGLAQRNHIETGVFSSFDWCAAWIETYCQSGEARQPVPLIVAGYDGDRLVFLFPLMRVHYPGLAVLTWLTDPFGQYGDVLCDRASHAKAWISAALTFLSGMKGIDLLYLRHIRAGSVLSSAAGELLVDAAAGDEAPYLDLASFGSEAGYEARYTSAQRKRRKKIRKGLDQLGPVSFAKVPAGSLADEAMCAALREKSAWLAERGRMNRILDCPRHLQFLKNLSRRSGSASLVLTQLKAGDRAVSWEIAFRHGKTHYAYLTSHVNSLTDLSPGRLHMDMSQRLCLAEGMATFDLMVPKDAHKESWSSAGVPTSDMFLPLTGKGRLAGYIYLRTVRPLLRALYYWLEPAALRWLNPKSYGFRARNLKADP